MARNVEIGELVRQLGRVTHALQFSGGLNPAQWEALRFLARANRYSCTPSALAAYLGTTKGTVSQTLIALESKGCVSRTRSGADRRSVRLALTERGRDLLRKDPLTLLQTAGNALPAAEGEAMRNGLDRFVGILTRTLSRCEFGICEDCRHLHLAGTEDGIDIPFRCGLTNDPLSEPELEMICVNFQTAH